MSKGILTSLLVVFLFSLPFCSRWRYEAAPSSKNVYHSLKIKVNLRDNCSRKRQNIKILAKFDDQTTRMLFLGPPLNRVYAKLLVAGETALLIDSRKKKYWQGDFKTLLYRMWDIDFDYQEFKSLIQEGIIPAERIKETGVNISIEKEKESGQPAAVIITGRDMVIRLKISDRRSRRGKIRFSENLEGLERTDIEEILENN